MDGLALLFHRQVALSYTLGRIGFGSANGSGERALNATKIAKDARISARAQRLFYDNATGDYEANSPVVDLVGRSS